MSVDTLSMEQLIKEENLTYYEYNEFINIEEIGSKLVDKIYKANWKQDEKPIVLKSFSLNDGTIKEIVSEVCKESFFFGFEFVCRCVGIYNTHITYGSL